MKLENLHHSIKVIFHNDSNNKNNAIKCKYFETKGVEAFTNGYSKEKFDALLYYSGKKDQEIKLILGDFVAFANARFISDNPELYKVYIDLEGAALVGSRTKESDHNLGDLQVHTVTSITEVPGS